MRLLKPFVVLIVFTLLITVCIPLFVPSVAHASTSYTWTGKGNDGQWSNSQNWSPNGVPGAGDSVTLGPNPTANVTIPASTTVQNLTLSGNANELSGGSLTITGTFSWMGYGTITTPIDIPSGATANITNASGEQKRLEANLSVEGSATVSGSGLVLGQMTITNTGTFTFEPGSALNALSCCVNPAQFINQGSVVVPSPASGTGSAIINAVAFNDQGTVSIGSNSTFDLQWAPSTFAAGVSFNGGGTLLIDYNANIQLNGTVNLGSGTTLQVGSPGLYGELTGTGTLTGTGSAFSWVNGRLNGTFTVASSVTSTISGTDQKLLQTSGGSSTTTLTLAGPTTLMSGSTLTFSGGGANLINTSTFTAQPGSIITAQSCCVNPAQFVNKKSFVVPSPASGTGSATINAVNFNDKGSTNIGSNSTLELQGTPSTFAAGVSFNGAGTLLIDYNADVQLSGTVKLGNGTTFLIGPDPANNATGELSGTGTLSGSGGIFSWTGGTINGTFTIASSVHTTISGNLQKLLQSPGGSQTTTLNLAGPTTLSGTGLVFTGGGAILNNSGTFSPQAGSTITAQSCCVNPAQFNNSGTLTISVGAGNTFSISAIAFNNSGTVNLKSGTFQFAAPGYTQAGGSTRLSGGALTSTDTSHANVTLNSGSLTGKGTITSNVQNGALIDAGTTVPGEGKITISGNYTQTSAGTLRVDIKGAGSPGTNYDELVVNGTATLNGTLDIETASGFTPASGSQFTVVKATTLTGTFATLLNAQLPNGLAYHASYTTTTATLKVK